jgi:glucose/arabinose dehydrogenase
MRPLIFVILASLLTFPAFAQKKSPSSLPAQPAGDDVTGRWTHLQKTPDNDPNEARIKAANGFHVNVFARGLEHARMLLAMDDGTVLLSRPKQNDVLELRDTDGDGRADRIATVASALGLAHVTDMAVTMDANGGKQRTKTDRIFRIDANRNADVAYAGEMLRAPNGIVWTGNDFIIGQNYGKDLLRWTPGSEPQVFGRGKGTWDGLVALPDGTLLASSHHDHAIHIVRNGSIEPLFAPRPTPADIGYDGKRRLLLIPSLDGDWVEAWHLPRMQPAPPTSVAMP